MSKQPTPTRVRPYHNIQVRTEEWLVYKDLAEQLSQEYGFKVYITKALQTAVNYWKANHPPNKP